MVGVLEKNTIYELSRSWQQRIKTLENISKLFCIIDKKDLLNLEYFYY